MPNINNFFISYDLYVFDLDFTVWHGCRPGFWAKSLSFPLKRIGNRLVDQNNDFIELEDGIQNILSRLEGKKISFITRGGLPDLEFHQQPVVICLKQFEIFSYFNFESSILFKDDKKSRVFKVLGRTVFIDDNDLDINDVKSAHPDVEILDKKNFKWNDLLKI